MRRAAQKGLAPAMVAGSIAVDEIPRGWLMARAALGRLASGLQTEQTSTARILDVTPDQYLADPCRVPSLNSTVAHAIVAESPLHGFAIHPRLGGYLNGTKAMQDGALMGRLLLGAGQDIQVIRAIDFRTNAAKDARDAALIAGRIPVLEHQLAEQEAIAAKLRDKCRALGYVFEGSSEVAVEWVDGSRDGPVLCRSMFDHVNFTHGSILDVKKVKSANPRDLARHFVEYGYDIQYTAYVRALGKLHPEFEGRVDFTFLFVEIEPPYSVVPARPDGALKEIGALRWKRALQLWHECRSSGYWPSYCDGEPITLEAPAYVVTQELGTWQ